MAAFLGLHGYGEFAVIAGVTALFQQFFDLRVGTFATVYATKYFGASRNRLAAAVLKLALSIDAVTGFLAFGLLWITAPLLVSVIDQPAHLISSIRIYGISLLVGTIEMSVLSLLKVTKSYRLLSYATTVPPVLTATLIIVASWLTANVRMIIWAIVAAKAASTLLQVELGRRGLSRLGVSLRDADIKHLAGHRKEYLRYLLGTNFIGYSTVVLAKLDTVVLARFASLDTLGLYRLAISTLSVLSIPGTAVVNSLLQVFARNWEQGRSSLTAIAREAVRISLGLTILGGATILLAGEPLLKSFVDDPLEAFTELVAVLLIAQLVRSLAAPARPFILAAGRAGSVAWTSLASLVYYPPVLILASRSFGVWGAAWSFVSVAVLVAFLDLFWASRILRSQVA